MPAKKLQRVTDPARAKAAFDFGYFSQWSCTPTLSESLSCLRRDVPTVTLDLLLGLLRDIDRYYAEWERTRNLFRQQDIWPKPERQLDDEPGELRFRLNEFREISEMAIPQNCELRKIFDLGRTLGALRRIIHKTQRTKVAKPITLPELKIALSHKTDSALQSKSSDRDPELVAAIEELRRLLHNKADLRNLMQGLVADASNHSSVEIANGGDVSALPVVEFLESVIEKLRVTVTSCEFDRSVSENLADVRNAWLYELAKGGVTYKELETALKEKNAQLPADEKWPSCGFEGIRDAVDEYAACNGLPPVEMKVGRPRSAKTGKKPGS